MENMTLFEKRLKVRKVFSGDAVNFRADVIRLPNGKSGLLHISRMGLSDGPARMRQMHGQFGVGKEVKVLVNAIDGDRVSLSLPGVKEQGNEVDEEEAAYNEYRQVQPKTDGPLGNMSSLFGALDKLKLD